MSFFNKKKIEERLEEVKSPIEKHKELLISLVLAYGNHDIYKLTCSGDDSFAAIKETIIKNLGKDYIFESSNGAHNLKYFCSVTFEEKEVSEVVIDD